MVFAVAGLIVVACIVVYFFASGVNKKDGKVKKGVKSNK